HKRIHSYFLFFSGEKPPLTKGNLYKATPPLNQFLIRSYQENLKYFQPLQINLVGKKIRCQTQDIPGLIDLYTMLKIRTYHQIKKKKKNRVISLEKENVWNLKKIN